MKKSVSVILWIAVGIVLPNMAFAGTGWADDIKNLNSVLDQLYDDMIPLCEGLIGVGRGIAGFAALWYIAARVWRHLASAEPIDFYPLLKPFALGLCIILFPAVIGVLNGVLSPTVTGTQQMVQNSDEAIATLLQQKEEAVKQSDFYQMYVGTDGSGDRDKWYQYTHDGQSSSQEGLFEGIGNDIRFALAKASYNFRNAIKEVISEVLQLLFAAAGLTINTMRTFNLIILAILGPLVFGFSVFDGLGGTLRQWLARYINVFLWLPVANIFGAVIGKIQENMLKIDIGQINQTGDTFFSKTDAGYLIFMLIGIFGYFTVPSIANHIIWVGGGDALTAKTSGVANAVMTGASGMAGGTISAAGGQLANGIQNLGEAGGNIRAGYNEESTGTGKAASMGRAAGQAGHYLRNKLSGDKGEA